MKRQKGRVSLVELIIVATIAYLVITDHKSANETAKEVAKRVSVESVVNIEPKGE